jgi:hypothetical protein
VNYPELKRFAIQIESIDHCAWDAAQEDMEADPELDFDSMLDSCIQVQVVGYQVATSGDEAMHLAAVACGFNDHAHWSDFYNAGDESYSLVAVDVSDEEPWENW